MKKFKPGELFNRFQAKKKKFEEKRRKAMPVLRPIGAGAPRGLSGGSSSREPGIGGPA